MCTFCGRNRCCCNRYNMAVGIPGPQGMQGAQGPQGPTGAAGVGATVDSAFAANTTGSVVQIVVAGTNIPLPDNHIISDNITINATNTVFTVAKAGTYLINYVINLSEGILVGSRVLINGVEYAPSSIPRLFTLSRFNNTFMVRLTAGSTVSLQLYGLLETVTLLEGAGAELSIVRVS